jgi:hypothetical protein
MRTESLIPGTLLAVRVAVRLGGVLVAPPGV